MEKISALLLALSLLLSNAVAFAQEESASQRPILAPGALENRASALPFEFSLNRGVWSNAKPGTPFSTGYHAGNFTLPSLRQTPEPLRYPRWAVREGWEGTFVIAVEVLPNGRVGRWSVMQSTGYSLLDETAAEAVRRWHFHPATEKGRAVVSCIEIPIHFTLQD